MLTYEESGKSVKIGHQDVKVIFLFWLLRRVNFFGWEEEIKFPLPAPDVSSILAAMDIMSFVSPLMMSMAANMDETSGADIMINLFLIALVPVGAVLFFLLSFHFKIVGSYAYKHIERMFGGPKLLPILGNSLEFLNLDSAGTFHKIQEFCEYNQRFARTWILGSPYVIIYKAKDVEVLLSSSTHIIKSNVYQFLHDWIGTGLLTSDGPKWKSHRKILTPAFHFKILEDFVTVFNDNGSILTTKLSEFAGKGTFNVYDLINLYALDNICETALGVKINAQKDSQSEYAKAVKDIRNVVTLMTTKQWLRFILNFTEHGTIYKKALHVLHRTADDIIQRRKKELENSDVKLPFEDDKDDNYVGQKQKLAFLDLLLLSKSLSDEEIREEVDTFMFAGHDTVTSGISFALYALAHNQDVQETAYQEQLQIFGDSDRQPTWQDLNEMKYLEMVIKETQRHYPSVPLIGRTIHEDLVLSDGFFLPQGSYCTVNITKLHKDPEVWPEPDKFNPDNFLPEAIRNRNPYSFIPFSAGPRNCIGQRFAMAEMKCCISKVLRRFKINPSKDQNNNVKPAGQLVLSSTNGIKIELENRNE